MRISHADKLRDELGTETYRRFISPIQEEYAHLKAQDNDGRNVQRLISLFSAAILATVAHYCGHGTLEIREAATIETTVIAFACWMHKCLHQDRSYYIQAMNQAQSRLTKRIPEGMLLLQESILQELGMGDDDMTKHTDDLDHQTTNSMVRSWIECLGPVLRGVLS